MFDTLTTILYEILFNIAQLIIGSLVSIAVFVALRKCKICGGKASFGLSFLLTAIFSLFGMLLPFGIFGVIPVFVALTAAGFMFYNVMPLVISNLLFNMLVPFNDPGFAWRTGAARICLAFIIGLGAGLILQALRVSQMKLLRESNLHFTVRNTYGIKTVLLIIDENIRNMGAFVLFGAIADTLLNTYILENVINFINTNSLTSAIPIFFSRYDVTNQYFLMTFIIAYTLINLVKDSALLFLFKPKGFIMYLAYFSVTAFILAVPAFFRAVI